jgi:hypothetical protein
MRKINGQLEQESHPDRANSICVEQIPICEVKFHAHSFFDPIGRLFWWNGQLYRGIRTNWTPFFSRLFQEGIIQKLVEQNLLIETKLTNLRIDGYELVVHHRTLPFLSYPHEWCAAMFKDAALTTIELAIELAKHGLTLTDPHPWNLLFDAYKPTFVDFSAIDDINDSVWLAYDRFCQFYLYPLLLMSQGQDLAARLLVYEGEGVLKQNLLGLTPKSALAASRSQLSVASRLEAFLRQQLPSSYLKQLKKTLNSIRVLNQSATTTEHQQKFIETIKQKSHLKFLENVKREIECISLPSINERGANPDNRVSPGLSNQDNWSVKQKNIYKILAELRPTSLLDIGCSTGFYSKLAALAGSQVLAFDLNPVRVTQLYHDARSQKLPILPLIMDFTKPTPSRGPCSHWSLAASDRFQCDMVLALKLVHHLVRDIYFEQIVEGLASFSKRWLVVEFIPLEDPEVADKWWSARMAAWYKLDNFIHALEKKFHSVSILPSHPNSRVLLLCEK